MQRQELSRKAAGTIQHHCRELPKLILLRSHGYPFKVVVMCAFVAERFGGSKLEEGMLQDGNG